MVPPSQDTSRQNSSPPPSLHLGVLTPPPKCEQEAQLSWPLSVDVAKSGKRHDLPRARHMPLVIRRGCCSPRQRKKAFFLKFSSSLLGGGRWLVWGLGAWGPSCCFQCSGAAGLEVSGGGAGPEPPGRRRMNARQTSAACVFSNRCVVPSSSRADGQTSHVEIAEQLFIPDMSVILVLKQGAE